MLWWIFIILLLTTMKYRQDIQQLIKVFIFKKLGIRHINTYNLIFNRTKAPFLVLHLKGIHIDIQQQQQQQQQQKMNQRQLTIIISKKVWYLLNIPIRLFMRIIANKVAIHMDNIVIENTLSVHVHHVYINSTLTTSPSCLLPAFSIHVQLGPIQLLNRSFVLIEVTTLCLVTLSCHLGTIILLQDIDLDIQVGKLNILDIQPLLLPSNNNKKTTFNNKLNSVGVKCQSIVFHYNNKLIIQVNDMNANVQQSSHITLQSGLVQCKIMHHAVFTMLSMEMKLSHELTSSSNHHHLLPHTTFMTVTCILNSPVMSLPLNHTELFNSDTTSLTIEKPLTTEKIISNAPMCTFALVMNSPKIELFGIDDNMDRCGYITTSSFIIRLSGEYMSHNNNSSSSSNLDSFFAQEEYQWLSNNNNSSRQLKTKKWYHFMGRVSRKQHVHPQQHKKWTYRLSTKVIVQKLSVGYCLEKEEYEFLKVKHAVLLFKMNMMTMLNNSKETYDTIFSLEKNSLHLEVALDKPIIYLWNDGHELPASLFWIQSLPLCLTKYKKDVKKEKKEKKRAAWIDSLVNNISFSLDVIRGSIVTVSIDNHHDHVETTLPPEGYFSNKPNENVYTRMILDTHKFTLACDGPEYNNISEWKIRCHLENLYIQQSSYILEKEQDEEQKKQHVMLWISQLNTHARFNSEENVLFLTTKIKKYGIMYSVRNHFVCLLLARSLMLMKQQLKVKTTTKNSLLMDIEMHVERGDVRMCLPQDIKLYLRLDNLSTKYETNSFPTIKFRNFMILGVSPSNKHSWEQIIQVDKAQITIKQRENQIELKSRKIMASIPYNYVLSTVIENIIALVKAIKELHSRILFQRLFTFFGPTINNEPIFIPCIHLKTRVFSIQFDDDPFEVKLRHILRTGLVEQQKRLAYKEALDDKAYDMLQQTSDSSTTNNMEDTTTPSLDTEVHVHIMEANKQLLEQYSNMWIKNINQTKLKEAKFYQELHVKENYRHSMTTTTTSDTLNEEPKRLESFTFTIDILQRPLAPPLTHFTAQFVKVSFQPPDFPLDQTRQFIHTIGGGVPLTNDFSIIIPFHLSIKAGKTYIKIRDYPLPLLYVPPPTIVKEDNTRHGYISWTLEGNYAIGDELGNSGGSRIIPVTIVPSSVCDGYCLSAVRTASPLKFYSVIDYHVLTPSMSTLCWSISYNPAIQDMMRVLDNLSSSSVDPSPRIGFWDKVRLMIHTQTKISFLGDLAFVVKGTRDPYELQGRGAGLAKIWSHHVVWLLGYQNPQNEFMQIISRDYAFGVPNLNQSSYVPNLLLDAMDKKHTISKKFLKVALKLSDGIRMGIGMHFERLGCLKGDCSNCESSQRLDRCRTQQFSPHYNVIYQSVNQVKSFYDVDTYDAFKGFRADFIHLSLSIVKLQNEEISESPDFTKDDPYFMTSGSVSQNSMYLSPCFIKHFLTWWRLFGSPVSLPVRQGNLFPREEEKPPSFGEHLDTVKYKIVISPLGIGYFCTDDETYLDVNMGGSAGLKARVNAFSVDLHSRKEMIKIGDAIKLERNFHELELELHDIDLRVVKASHIKGVQTKEDTTTSYDDAMSFDQEEEESTSYSFQWVDSKDYIILDSVPQQNNLKRKIEVHPFAFSPLLYYVKQNDKVGTEKRQYLRGTHDCIMGKGMDAHDFQKAHLNRRASDLDTLIENHDKQLDVILNAMNSMKYHDQETLHEQHDTLLAKLHYLRTHRYMLHNYIAQVVLETELNNNRGGGSPNTTTSSICRRDELFRWETLMGHFKDRFFIHNPQIIWNNSVRDIIYYWQDIKNSQFVQDYNLSARCLLFLEDLVRTAEKQQEWKPDVPTNTKVFTEDVKMDTEALIEKLLFERKHNFVAYNEKEEEKEKPMYNTFIENVNDPDDQYKNIPDNYEMKSKYLIDMIHPQVNFQSEKGLNHLILFTNERIHVKAFEIVDNTSNGSADKDIRFVKDRIIVSLDNAELLVAKRMEVLSFHLLTQSAYGQCRNLHWSAWVHPEHVWYYKDMKYFDNFQRVASQLSGTIQLDRYNHLRIKIDKYNTSSRQSPFEDRTNTMQLYFPYFKLTLNSQQGHVLYYTLINLLLGNDAPTRKKQRLNKFKDVMLAAERSDLAETVKQVGVLQNRSRSLMDMHTRFLDRLSKLDSVGLKEFHRNRKKMRENLEKLYLVVEAIKSIQTFRRDIHLEETDNAMRFSFTSDEIVWEAVMENDSPLCQWIFLNTKYVFLDKQNGSSKNTIEIDKMQIQNTTDSPIFINVLDRFFEAGEEEITTTKRQQKMVHGVLESLPPVGGIPVIQQLEINVLPLHLQISTAFGSAMKDYFFPLKQEDLFVDSNDDDDSIEIELSRDSSSLFSLSVDKSNASTLSKREGSFASFDLITQKVKQTVIGKKKITSDELTIMKKRSSTNRTFIYVRIPATKHCLSLQGPSRKTFYNLYNFTFEQPNLEYRNKTWSVAEMMEDIQRQFLRAILRHSPALLKNKLLSNKQPIHTSSSSIHNNNNSSSSSKALSVRSMSSSKMNVLRDDSSSSIRQSGNTTDADTMKSSYNTEDEGDEVKSLHSVDPEEEAERIAKRQGSEKRLSFNVDKELADIYLIKYKKEEEEEVDELVVKGKKLFGEKYRRNSAASNGN